MCFLLPLNLHICFFSAIFRTVFCLPRIHSIPVSNSLSSGCRIPFFMRWVMMRGLFLTLFAHGVQLNLTLPLATIIRIWARWRPVLSIPGHLLKMWMKVLLPMGSLSRLGCKSESAGKPSCHQMCSPCLRRITQRKAKHEKKNISWMTSPYSSLQLYLECCLPLNLRYWEQ